MRRFASAIIPAALTIATPAAANPALPAAPAVFDSAPLADGDLAMMRGTARSGFLAVNGRSLADADAYVTFRSSGDVNRLTFDNWFTDIGSGLIFSNIVRSIATN